MTPFSLSIDLFKCTNFLTAFDSRDSRRLVAYSLPFEYNRNLFISGSDCEAVLISLMALMVILKMAQADTEVAAYRHVLPIC